ncbi:patatin family protein [Adlercreutzia sp. ZJ473]|uniref:patatin-like phospholipase family protein n=1 Tax=Adlercreutzia sp. ZJ473 TaxID=2722822 RepID=UPI001557C85A|nr:patatin family protein [Adlercreutzia sp. ZJ473]
MRTGIVDVGGGLRGIYAAGVLDFCLDRGIAFDLGIGVSAGSANLASFTAGQKGRNKVFYSEYALRKQYMSLGNFIRKGSYVDLDYVYGTLSDSNGENPLDYPALRANPMDLYVVATNAHTGEPRYFGKEYLSQDGYDILKASSALPFACRPYPIDGIRYFDGALGDAVPVQKALELGCDKVVVLLTKPKDTERTPGKDAKVARLIKRTYPQAAARLRSRAARYNASVAFAKKLEAEGRALIVAPDDTCGVDTLTKDREAILRLYAKGYADGAAIERFVERANADAASTRKA